MSIVVLLKAGVHIENNALFVIFFLCWCLITRKRGNIHVNRFQLVFSPRLFLTAAAVFISEGVPLELVRRVVGSGMEVLFMAALLMTDMRLETLRSVLERRT
jgi:hypothetical protein